MIHLWSAWLQVLRETDEQNPGQSQGRGQGGDGWGLRELPANQAHASSAWQLSGITNEALAINVVKVECRVQTQVTCVLFPGRLGPHTCRQESQSTENKSQGESRIKQA